MPGVAFGLDGYLRLSYCGSVSDIVEGMDRIKVALEKYL
jgi:aspartate aminotransferase